MAVARRPALSMGDGLTTAGLGRPDIDLARRQHDAYCKVLDSCGVEVILLDAAEGFPDSTFVEDVAVIAGGRCIITRPGHPSRLGETALIEPVLSEFIDTGRIKAPGMIDGGDVLEIDDQILIGLSARTDKDGASQLASFFGPAGYRCETVSVPAGLHLKSSLSYLGGGTVLAAASAAGMEVLSGLNVITAAPGEEYCANSILVNGRLIFPSGFPVTLEKLRTAGLEVIETGMSEFRKMDGGLSCLSLRMNV
jgi:dimethylargininase